MKKFFLYFAVLLVLLVICDFGVGCFFKSFDSKLAEYPISYQNAYYKMAMGKNNTDDMVIVGHSRARHHYIPKQIEDSLGITVINAAKDGTDYLSQAILINKIVKNCSTKYILWEVRPYIFHQTSQKELNRLTDLNPFYDIDSLSREYVQKRSSYEKYKMFSYAYRNNGRFWGLLETYVTGRKDDGRKGYAPTRPSMKHPTMKQYDYEDQYEASREKLFVEVVNNVRKSGRELIMAISPQYETSNIYELNEVKRFYYVADSLQVPVLDFFYHKDFLSDSTLFKDHTHLNQAGAVYYMEIFIPELKNTINHVQ